MLDQKMLFTLLAFTLIVWVAKRWHEGKSIIPSTTKHPKANPSVMDDPDPVVVIPQTVHGLAEQVKAQLNANRSF